MIRIKINRLMITQSGNIAYDERFHDGVNIIRGDNGSGKSTIANSLFYAIGGEYTDWLPESLKCDYTIVEVNINESILTFKREISVQQMRPMEIFHGNMDDALKSNIQGWKVFGYKRSENRKSFSEYLFSFLNIPDVKTTTGDAITLNQIYRLIYIDQLSSISALLNNEDFDSPLVRSTIGSLMLGTYSDELYSKQLEYRKKKKALDETLSDYKFLKRVLDASDTPSDLKEIQRLSEGYQKNLIEIDDRIVKIENNERVSMSKLSTELDKIGNNLNNEKRKLKELNDIIYRLEINLIDSQDFISELNDRLIASEESLLMRNYLNDLPISYCPSCLEELEPVDEGNCKVCKQPLTEKKGKERVERMKVELKTQISESEALMEKKRGRLEERIFERQEIKSRVNRLEGQYSRFIENSKSKTQRIKDGLLVEKGQILSSIDDLEQKAINVNKYYSLGEKVQSLAGEVSLLDTQIKELEHDQKNKEREARNSIESITLNLLHADGGYEKFFANSTDLSLDFYKNSFYLNKRNHFSASSMVYLKNAVRYSIFFSSLKHNYFRYPRFIICDNMEDKGMNSVRSGIFQKNIVQLAESMSNKDFQIIFTTSMIAKELDIDKYTVGDEYSPSNKTLKLN
ncbi:MAG: AAA family ATPase [Bacteroidota bacterium]